MGKTQDAEAQEGRLEAALGLAVRLQTVGFVLLGVAGQIIGRYEMDGLPSERHMTRLRECIAKAVKVLGEFDRQTEQPHRILSFVAEAIALPEEDLE